MRAAVLRTVHGALEVRDDVAVDDPGPGEVKVRIRASGVCHSDLSIVDGTLPHPLPCILGHEGAGEVVDVGPDVTSVQAGDRVILSWIALCGTCFFCLRGQAHLCTSTGMTILPRFRLGADAVFSGLGTATFAEETVVPALSVIPIDDDVPFDVAALVGCGVTTGVGAACNTAKVQPGSTAVVIGCGGVGINVVQGCRLAGAAVILAVDAIEAKREWARQFGATDTAHPDELPEITRALTDGLGFDFAFEVVGKPETIRAAWDATRRAGTTVVVGAGSTDAQVPFSPFELFFFERRLLGCVYGSADPRVDFPRLLRLWRNGRLDLEGLITRRVGLEDVDDAFGAMQRGEVIRTVVEL